MSARMKRLSVVEFVVLTGRLGAAEAGRLRLESS
jgi:hypothetical protein